MSQESDRVPGDIAPLPSPTSEADHTGHYFSHFSAPTEYTSAQPQHPHSSARLHFQTQSQTSSQYATGSSFNQQAQNVQGSSSLQAPMNPSAAQQDSSIHHSNRQLAFENRSQLSGSRQQQQQPNAAAGGTVHEQQRISESSTDSEANMRLRDFSLLAEAAKRAQVAVVTRDMEEISL